MQPATNDDPTDALGASLAMGEVSATDADARPLEARLRDHASIGRLADDLLPALIAKLGVTALGEIEVREGEWKVRLRRPSDALGPMYGRRATDRPSRAQPGHSGHGHAPGAVEPHRAARELRDTPSVSGPAGDASAASRAGSAGGSIGGAGAPNGSHHHLTAVGPGPDPGARVGRMGHIPEGEQLPAGTDPARDDSPFRAVATSPAVGIFQARGEARPGSRVRAGDRLASVDVLGVPQPVVAPVDGLVGATLVEHGDPVEYGQELIRIELAVRSPHDVAAAPGTSGVESSAQAAPDSPSPAATAAGGPSAQAPSEPGELVANAVTPRAPGNGGA